MNYRLIVLLLFTGLLCLSSCDSEEEKTAEMNSFRLLETTTDELISLLELQDKTLEQEERIKLLKQERKQLFKELTINAATETSPWLWVILGIFLGALLFT